MCPRCNCRICRMAESSRRNARDVLATFAGALPRILLHRQKKSVVRQEVANRPEAKRRCFIATESQSERRSIAPAINIQNLCWKLGAATDNMEDHVLNRYEHLTEEELTLLLQGFVRVLQSRVITLTRDGIADVRETVDSIDWIVTNLNNFRIQEA